MEPGGFARRDGAVLAKGGTKLRQPLKRGVGTRRLIIAEDQCPFLSLDFHRDNLVLELARFLSLAETPLRALGETILRLPCQFCIGDEILRMPAGVLCREGVVETVAQHAVMDLGRTHPVAPPTAATQIRRTIKVR